MSKASDLLRELRATADQFGIASERIKAGRCEARMDTMPKGRRPLIVNMDKAKSAYLAAKKKDQCRFDWPENGKLCDYMLFMERPSQGIWALLFELKEGKVKSDSIKQLQAGARTFQEFIEQKNYQSMAKRFSFYPVLVSKGEEARISDRFQRGEVSVSFRGKSVTPIKMSCGDQIWDALPENDAV